jgi:hypothetical protein
MGSSSRSGLWWWWWSGRSRWRWRRLSFFYARFFGLIHTAFVAIVCITSANFPIASSFDSQLHFCG